jgi:hypothetical protein
MPKISPALLLAAAVLVSAATLRAAEPAAPPAAADKNNDLLTQTVAIERIRHERAITLYHLAMERAEKALADADWDQAARSANDALALLDENRDDLWGTELVELRSHANKAMTAAQSKTRIAGGILPKPAAKPATPSDAELARQVAAVQRRKQIQSLRDEAKAYAQQHRFIEAVDSYRALLALVPDDAEARTALRLLQDTANFRTFARLAEQQSAEQTNQSLESKETLIPYGDPVTYPADWVEKNRTRQ